MDSFHSHTLVLTDASGRAAACATIGHTMDAAGNFENGGGPALTLTLDLDGMEASAFPLSTGSESAVGGGSNGLSKYPGYNGAVRPSGKITVVQEKTNEVGAVVAPYPGYTGTRLKNVAGWVRVQNGVTGTSGQLTVEFSLFGLEPNSEGGLHVHRGATCADAGPHFYDVVGAGQREDPWTSLKRWIADMHGHAAGTFTVIPGPNSLDVLGRTVVIHDIGASPGNGNRVACGVLQNMNFAKVSYEMTGLGEVTSGQTGGVNGVNADANGNGNGGGGNTGGGGGANNNNNNNNQNQNSPLLTDTGIISIHSGTTCQGTNVQIGATYKNEMVLGTDADPWRTEYVADRRGEARGSFVVAYGYSLRETRGRTVVVTDYDGNKVACGVLNDAERSSEEFAARQSVRGQISLHDGAYCGEEPSASYHGKAAAGVTEGVDPWSSVKYTTDEFGHAEEVMMVK